jgi:IS5 family transposase
MQHELVILSEAIDWSFLESKVCGFYTDEGRPGLPVRLIAGIHILKQMFNLSDEAVCERWICDPYFQYFCGEEYFQHELSLDRSSMTQFRKRVGEEFCIALLQESLNTAHQLGALETEHMEKVITDTTVQPKAVTFPTDAKLYYKAMVKLANLARKNGVELRQSYVRIGKQLSIMAGRYRHAKQMKRAKKAENKLRNRLGRVIRDIERKITGKEELEVIFTEAKLSIKNFLL